MECIPIEIAIGICVFVAIVAGMWGYLFRKAMVEMKGEREELKKQEEADLEFDWMRGK